MNTIDIYRSGSIILSPAIDQGTTLVKSLNGEDLITASFSRDTYTLISIGDYITFRGATYTIRKTPEINKVSEVEYEYNIQFAGPQYALLDAKYLLDGDMEFYLTGTAEDFIDLIVSNLNRVHGAGSYFTGSVDSTDYKVLHFNGDSCLQVLQRVCQEFELEFSLTGSSPTSINAIDTIGNATGLSYQYKAGLYNIKKTRVNNKELITRLYPFGSEKNLGPDYADRRTRTPLGLKLRLDYSTYPDNYIEQNVATYGLKEATKEFPDIYPHFNGTVDSTSDGQHVIDASIDFDLNGYLIEGITAKIVFLTGDLSGYEFEIISFNNSSKEVYFKTYTDEQGNVWPSGSIIPAIGDQFTFVDISMPPAYIAAAEAELLSEATAYLNDASTPSVIYQIEMDWHQLKTAGITLDIGDVITVTDAELASGGVSVRITEFTQQLDNPFKYTVKLGDSIIVNYFKKVENDQNRIQKNIILSNDNSITRTRRGYRVTADLQDMIFDTDGYFDTEKIKPLSIETGMITVGMKSQQLTVSSLEFNVSPGGDLTQVIWTAGTLVHFTIAETIKTWNISSNSITSLTSTTSYYVYARCAKSTTGAVILITTTQYQADPDDGYYYFLLGVLHGAVDSERVLSLTYGSTSIAGRQIRTGKIASVSGTTYFDLDNNQIVMGGVSIADANTAAATAQSTAEEAQTTADNAESSAVNSYYKLEDIASDSKFTPVEKQAVRKEWDVIYDEVTENESQGTTFGLPALRDSYRNAYLDLGVYLNAGAWNEIDVPLWISDAQLSVTTNIVGSAFRSAFKNYYDARTALLNAVADKAKELADTAQSTADVKKRHFTSTPTTPYSLGDTWTDGSVLKVCATALASGTFNSAHWVDATTYDNTQDAFDSGIDSGYMAGFTLDTNKLSFNDSNGRLLLINSMETSGYGRGLTIIKDPSVSPIGKIMSVRVGQIAVKDNLTSLTDDLGFEIMKCTAAYTYKHIMRIGGTEALIAGWNIDEESIYVGTKKTSNGYATSGITLASNGSIHAENFYINSDGSIAAKNITLESVPSDGSVAYGNTKIVNNDIYTNQGNSAEMLMLNRLGGASGKSRTVRIYDGNGGMIASFEGVAGLGASGQVFKFFGRYMNLAGLQTSATGLSTGDVWRDGTTLRIV